MHGLPQLGSPAWGVWLAVLVVIGLNGCGGGEKPKPTRTATPTPTATTPTAEATGTPTPTPAPDALDWRSSEHNGQPVRLVRSGSGFLGLETRAVASLSASGRIRWRFRGPATDDFRGFVVRGVPVAVTRRGGRHTVQGLDPRTGATIWSAQVPADVEETQTERGASLSHRSRAGRCS